MTLSKEKLESMAEKYDARALRAYYNYQETGTQRYDRERSNYEDMADALRMAAAAADDHNLLISIQGNIRAEANRAEIAIRDNAPREELEAVLRSFISIAAVSCKYDRIETIPQDAQP